MYSFSSESRPHHYKVECSCQRKFLPQELYFCYYCNKIVCRYCLVTEYEYYQCKHNCKRNQYLNLNQAKAKKNCCDLCLECPVCFTPLTRQKINGVHLYRCPFCYWDTVQIQFAKEKEAELDVLIGQFQEVYCGGLLKKMYLHALEKLKKDAKVSEEKKPSLTSQLLASTTSDVNFNEIVQKAMEKGAWNLEKLSKSLQDDAAKYNKQNYSENVYDDNYINDEKSTYFQINFIHTLLSSNIDYTEKVIPQIASVDELTSRLKNELDFSKLASLDQRHNYITFQQPIKKILFPKFAELVPQRTKFAKKCKQCLKSIIQASEIAESKTENIKLEIQHLFTNQFPNVTIYKLNTDLKCLMLKFSLPELKEVKISFEPCEDNAVSVTLPEGDYELGRECEDNSKYVFVRNERSIVLNFYFKDEYMDKLREKGSAHFLKFLIKAEYMRANEDGIKIEYKNEVKFTVE